jgi:cytochrome c-type protein NapB
MPDPLASAPAPARTHAELERRPWTGGPAASGWAQSQRIAAKTAVRDTREGVPAEEAVQDRAARRAFDGAPPVIPHPVRASGAAECLACHAQGFALGGRRASPVPHAAYASCTQCHVTDSASFTRLDANPAARVESRWQGLASPTSAAIAYEGAPPAVPHSTWMRERCESCHGPEGRAALRTPHPERRSCLQCHPSTGGRGLRASR